MVIMGTEPVRLVMLKGLPASGKTTWALKEVTNSNGYVKRVCKDDLRAMIDGGKHSNSREETILEVRDALIDKFLRERHIVIVDDTNLHPKHEEHLRELAKKCNRLSFTGKEGHEVEFIIKEFPIELEEAIERDAKRGEKSVGYKVIKQMYFDFIRPKLKVKQDPSLVRAVICDLDGTLCLHNGRGPFEYLKCDTDLPNEALLQWLLEYKKKEDHRVLFVSGRENLPGVEEKTIEWLEKYKLMTNGCLFMRPVSNYESDYKVKKAIYEDCIKSRFYIEYVFDDRDKVVTLWRDLGFNCYQVSDGNF